jgi:drug/metabolite transporter (DMT)-like permease
LGPIFGTCLRLLLAGSILCLFLKAKGISLDFKKNWKFYLVVGLLNSVIPFVLFGYAVFHIPASYAAVINSSPPLLGAVFAALFLGDKLSVPKIIGLFLGALGVSVICFSGHLGNSALQMTPQFLMGIVAGFFGSVSFALAAIYVKKFSNGINPMVSAGTSILLGGLTLIPFSFLQNPIDVSKIDFSLVMNFLVLSLVCSGALVLIYYELIRSAGPAKTLMIFYLTPIFGLLWGYLFLGEQLGLVQIAGATLIVAGIKLVIAYKPAVPVVPAVNDKKS